MAFDETGNYIYIFDGTIRKTISVNTKSIYNTLNVESTISEVVGSRKDFYEDITAGIDSMGNLVALDDYSKLQTFYYYNLKNIAFCDGS